MTDMRGFTAFSNAHPPEQVIARLNAVFGCIVPAVEAEGGEVLKLIGDGLLAISLLSTARPATYAPRPCARPRLRTWHWRRWTSMPVRCGMALHLGEVSYGNIGAGDRLDFTAIGPAVNLAARLESLTAGMGRTIVLSSGFAGMVAAPQELLGSFDLRGFPEPVPVYGLAA